MIGLTEGVRFSVPDSAEHVGGLTLFGRGFGNYNQDIEFHIQYEREWIGDGISCCILMWSFTSIPNSSSSSSGTPWRAMRTPGISGFISVFDSACFSLFGLCCLHGFLVKAVYPASRNNRNADSVAHFSSFCGLKWYKIHLFSRGGGKKGWERGMKLCYWTCNEDFLVFSCTYFLNKL